MIDINKIKKDLINYGAIKVYEYDVDWVQEEEEDPVVLNNNQLVDIMANRYDIVKVNINLISRTEGEPDSVAIVKSVFVRTLYVDQDNTKMLIYTESPDDDGTMSQIIISCINGAYSYQMVDTDIGGGGGGTGTEVSGTNDGTNWTSLTIDGDTYGIPQGGGAEIEYATNADIDALFEEPEPEDIPVESIEFTNLPEDHSIELNVGDVVDMSQYIEVSPANATDKSYTLTTDAPSVLSVNGTTITVLQGSEGLNANLTVTANDGSGCSDIMIVDILNGEEPDPEEDIPIESLRYTDGQGHTCAGFGMLEGERVDLWTNLEITPSDATSGVEFMSDDDGIIQVDGTGIATATGSAGESTIITMSSMDDPSIETTVEISINMDEDEEE